MKQMTYEQAIQRVVAILEAQEAKPVNTWDFAIGEQTVRVRSSPDMSPELWSKLNEYVQLIRPAEAI
jgi:hypothetical protein